MAVDLKLDSSNLAKIYEEISDSQFADGCILLERMGLKPGFSVLDIGCGTGALGRHVLKIIGTAGRYVGVDPLSERIKLANAKNRHLNALYRIGIAEDLSMIEDSSVDAVYLNWVFHWVHSKETALKEIFRVLKPGGKVGFVLAAKELYRFAGINQISDKILSEKPYNNLVNLEDAVHKKHGLTTTELIELLADAGLKMSEVQVKALKREFESARHVMNYFEASFFGNYLNHVPEAMRDQVKNDIENELGKKQTAEGISFTSYVIFAIAQKSEAEL